MRLLLSILMAGFLPVLPGAEQTGNSSYSKIFDWPGEDGGYNIRSCSDGGFVIAGNTADSGGNRDFLILKVKANLEPDPDFGEGGRVRVGGSGEDQAADVLEILGSNGRSEGYLVVGQSDRADGDFASQRQWGKIDTVVLRLDPRGRLDPHFGNEGTGIRFYGTSGDDEPIVHRHNYSEPGERLVKTEDGFIVATHVRDEDGDVEGIPIQGVHSGRDVFLFKIDRNGEFVEAWADRGRFLLGTNRGSQDRQRENANDFIFSIQLHPDGSLIGGGYTLGKDIFLNGQLIRTMGNNDDQGADNAFGDGELYKMDGMVIRLTPQGRLDRDWGQEGVVFLGGTRQEKMYDVAIDERGRYLIAGRTASYDLQMRRPPDQGDGFDMLLMRLNPDGSQDITFADEGKRIFAGPEDDQGLRVQTLPDGRIVLLGQSSSPSAIFGYPDKNSLFRQAILLVLDDNGAVLDFHSLGGPGEEKPSSCVVESSGRVVLTGFRIPGVTEEYDEEGPEIVLRQLWVASVPLEKSHGSE